MASPSKKRSDFFDQPLSVANIGLSSFAESLRQQDTRVIEGDWRPPRVGVPRLAQTSGWISIDEANEQVLRRIMAGPPMLVGLDLAGNVIPGMEENSILHAGPPINRDRMCRPTRGAVMGALIYEGVASSPEGAAVMASKGEIAFDPCHQHEVRSMAGVLSPSMAVWIVENTKFGNRAFYSLNEGLGNVLRYGAFGEDVYERLHWIRDVLYPALAAALISSGPIDLRAMIAQTLHMEDECYNRNRAGTSLFLRAIGPALARTCKEGEKLAKIIEFIDGNDHFFLNLSMPAAKAMLEPAEGVEGSSVLTVMARNGTDFGNRMAGEPDRWFIAPAGIVDGLYPPGFSAEDANPDIGDATITETAGFDGSAIAAAPAIANFVGGTAQDAIQSTLEMFEICFAEHYHFTIPPLDNRGTPTGIDARYVAETGILPKLNAGFVHNDPGIGIVGAGILRAPEECFRDAFEALQSM